MVQTSHRTYAARTYLLEHLIARIRNFTAHPTHWPVHISMSLQLAFGYNLYHHQHIYTDFILLFFQLLEQLAHMHVLDILGIRIIRKDPPTKWPLNYKNPNR